MKHSTYSWFLNRRLWVILGLGFLSGLPLGLSGATLQAWYATSGLDIKLIGALTLVGQPYVFKFLWAPVLDKVRLPWLTVRRDWLLLLQIGLALLLCIMGFSDPSLHPIALSITALFLAIVSATQDIAIDAYRTELLKPEERGLGSAVYVAGYRIAMLISGGLALIIAHIYGFSTVYFMMAALMAVGTGITLLSPAISDTYHKRALTWMQVIREPWKQWFSRDKALLILLLVILYKLSDALAMSLSTVFLLKGLGLSLAEVGWVNKVIGFAATILGALTGGMLLARWSLYRSLMVFGVVQGVSNLAYFLLAYYQTTSLMWAMNAVFIENFCAGLGTSALVAFLMALCHPQYAATQFALLTALSAVGRVWVGPFAGYLVSQYGWVALFGVSVFLAIPGLWLLWRLEKFIPGKE